MDDCSELALKNLCCTCLSRDRNLSQLCRLKEGVNNLYLLLSFDAEAYRKGFLKDTTSWYICWECWAIMERISRFRFEACLAQKHLADIVDGRIEWKQLNICFSRLSKKHQSGFDDSFVNTDPVENNFVDCGADAIKIESDDDVPLSEYFDNFQIDKTDSQLNDSSIINKSIGTSLKKKQKKNGAKSFRDSNKDGEKLFDYNKYFRTVYMNEAEMIDSREKRKLIQDFGNAKYKCESCIQVYKNEFDLNKHNSNFHAKKSNRNQCDICLVYTKKDIELHKYDHYVKYECKICNTVAYRKNDIMKHVRVDHGKQNLALPLLKKVRGTTSHIRKTRLKPNVKGEAQEMNSFGYPCTECDKYFENKSKRWKHTQICHGTGHKCSVCGKVFSFRHNLGRHELTHKAPLPREECAICKKMVRVDLHKAHSRIHSQRERFCCAECDKVFVSRASYEHHLKYTQAHASVDILKYKCGSCDKGYRSRGELRDHINYQHMGKTTHKCPVCGKALATKRCIRRHVRRAHDGIKESERDKVCQQCGKTFRHKKSLREHELIHTGERPLSCEICGCTFRQTASLYTHKKRVHKIYPQRKNVTLDETTSAI